MSGSKEMGFALGVSCEADMASCAVYFACCRKSSDSMRQRWKGLQGRQGRCDSRAAGQSAHAAKRKDAVSLLFRGQKQRKQAGQPLSCKAARLWRKDRALLQTGVTSPLFLAAAAAQPETKSALSVLRCLFFPSASFRSGWK